MLTNAAAPTTPPTDTATIAIAIDDAERRCHAALRDIARLVRSGQISALDASDLEAEAITRLTARTRELEERGEQPADAHLLPKDDAPAHRPAAVTADRRPRTGSRGPSARARALRERQMCVVQSARVSRDVLRGLWLDDDEETLATRGDLAAAGLL